MRNACSPGLEHNGRRPGAMSGDGQVDRTGLGAWQQLVVQRQLHSGGRPPMSRRGGGMSKNSYIG
jgi:hypothetical protein